MNNKKLSNWKLTRENVLISILKLEPDILKDKDLEFRFGNSPNTSILFKYGIIAIDKKDLLILGLNGSMPEHIATKLINALMQHCANQNMNMGITPIDENDVCMEHRCSDSFLS